MPGFSDTLTGAKRGPGQISRVTLALDAMDDDTRALALELLDSTRGNERVAAAFTSEGHPLSASSVRNYRVAHELGIYRPGMAS